MLRRHEDCWIDKEKLDGFAPGGYLVIVPLVRATSKIVVCLYVWVMPGGGDQPFWEALGTRLSFIRLGALGLGLGRQEQLLFEVFFHLSLEIC